MLNDIVISMPTPHIRLAIKFAKFIQDNKIHINDRGELVHNHKVSENTDAKLTSSMRLFKENR